MAATLFSGAQVPSSDGTSPCRAPKVTLPVRIRGGRLRGIYENFAANPVSEHLNKALRARVTGACTSAGYAKIIGQCRWTRRRH
jgi:hypothetical protein